MKIEVHIFLIDQLKSLESHRLKNISKPGSQRVVIINVRATYALLLLKANIIRHIIIDLGSRKLRRSALRLCIYVKEIVRLQ